MSIKYIERKRRVNILRHCASKKLSCGLTAIFVTVHPLRFSLVLSVSLYLLFSLTSYSVCFPLLAAGVNTCSCAIFLIIL